MKNLEGLARELFTEFSIKETGRAGNWDYLSDERKAFWMKDVLRIAKFLIREIKKDFKPLPTGKTSTVYESAYMEGVRSERLSHDMTISHIEEDLVNELAIFQDNIQPKK